MLRPRTGSRKGAPPEGVTAAVLRGSDGAA